MANTLDILIRIKEVGFKLLDDLNKKLKELQNIGGTVKFDAIEQVGEKINEISKNIERVAQSTSKVIDSVASQAQDVAATTAGRIGKAGRSAQETFLARLSVIGVIVTAMAGTVLATIAQRMYSINTVFDLINRRLSSFGSLSKYINQNLISADLIMGAAHDKIKHLKLPIELINHQAALLARNFNVLLSVFRTLIASSFDFFVLKFAFQEISVLIRRIIGKGEASLTPLQRASRLVSTLDIGLHQAELTMGRMFKTAMFGILTFVGPFNGILMALPFLNSMITSVLNVFTVPSLKIKSFFGDVRSSLVLIFLHLRKLGKAGLPAMLGVAKGFTKMRKEADKSENVLRKMGSGEQLRPLQALSKMKFPMAKQFQSALVEFRMFAQEMIKKLAVIAATLQLTLGASTADIENIEQKANKALSSVKYKIDTTVKAFENGPNAAKRFATQTAQALQNVSSKKLQVKSDIPRQEKLKNAIKEIENRVKISQEKAREALGKTEQKFKDQAQAVRLVSNGFQGLRQTVKGVSLPSNFVVKFDVALKSLSKEFHWVAKLASEAMLAVFDFNKNASSGLKIKTSSDYKKLAGFFASLDMYLKGASKLESFKKRLNGLTESLRKFALVTKDKTFADRIPEAIHKGITLDKTKLATALLPLKKALSSLGNEGKIAGKHLNEQLTSYFAKSVKGLLSSQDVSRVRDALSNFMLNAVDPKKVDAVKDAIMQRAVQGLENSGSKLKASGEKITKQLSNGIKEGGKHVRKAGRLTAQDFMDYAPQSPAKVGPLRKLVKSGSLIPYYLSQGIKNGKKHVKTASKSVAENIANFFPRSLPVVGPLVKLVKMGLLIPYYLGIGIKKGISGVISIVDGLANKIREVVDKAALSLRLSFRAGVDVEKIKALDNALLEAGAKAQDLQYAFVGIRKSLNTAFDAKKMGRLSQIGIDMDSIRRSTDPVLALFFAVSDALKRLPLDSKAAREALDLVGVTAQSNVINVMMRGSKEIRALMKDSAELGTTYSSAFAKMSQKTSVLIKRFEQIKESVLNEFVGVLLPHIIEVGNKLLDVWRNNSSYVKAFFIVAANVINQLFSIIEKAVQFAIKEPKKAMDKLVSTLEITWEIIVASFDLFMDVVYNRLLMFMSNLGILIVSFPIEFVKQMFVEIKRVVSTNLDNLWLIIQRKFISFLGDKSKRKILDFFSPGVSMSLGPLLKHADVLEKKITNKLRKSGVGVYEWGNVFKKTLVDVKKNAEELGKALEHVTTYGLSDKASVDAYKTKISNLTEQLKQNFAGTPMEAEAFKIKELISQNAFDDALKKVEELKQKWIKSIDDIGKKQLELSEQNKNNVIDHEALAAADMKRKEEALHKEMLETVDQHAKLAELRARSSEDTALKHEAELAQLQAKHMRELESYKDMKLMQAHFDEILALQKEEKEKLLEKQQIEVFHGYLSNAKNVTGGVANLFTQLSEVVGKENKKMFLVNKAVSMATAIVNVAQGVTKALGQGGIMGIAMGALVAAAGAIQVTKIAAQQPQGFAEGGFVAQGTGEKADNVPAWLSHGEFVIPAERVRQVGVGFLEGIRQGRSPLAAALTGNVGAAFRNLRTSLPGIAAPAFAGGGSVSAQPTIKTDGGEKQTADKNINIMNILEPNLFDQWATTPAAEQAILNMISANPYEFQARMSGT